MQEQSVSTYVSAIFQESKSDSWFFFKEKARNQGIPTCKKRGSFLKQKQRTNQRGHIKLNDSKIDFDFVPL